MSIMRKKEKIQEVAAEPFNAVSAAKDIKLQDIVAEIKAALQGATQNYHNLISDLFLQQEFTFAFMDGEVEFILFGMFSGIDAIIADLFEILFRDMLDQPADEVHGRQVLFHVFVENGRITRTRVRGNAEIL